MSSWVIAQKPGFLSELMALSSKHRDQVLNKIRLLETDPHADGHTKKKLKHMGGKLHRLRSGDFRAFYTYDSSHVSLLALRRRDDSTYNDSVEAEFLGAGPAHGSMEPGSSRRPIVTYADPLAGKTLPEPITVELLDALGVAGQFHARLLIVADQDALLACPGVPAELLLAIDRHMFEQPITLRAEEPELVSIGGIDDLMRFADGELVGFLLRLNPEQDKFVTWATSASGPTLVKGGPGTGKSTVAIYRTREMIRVLREQGIESPRILFTTYTNALVTFSKQLLGSLLGDDATCVDIRTADSLVGTVLGKCGRSSSRPNASQRETCRSVALANGTSQGNALQRAASGRTLERLGRSYLFEEIETVIQARGLMTVENYLVTPRPGRRIPLTESQRRTVWATSVEYADALREAGFQTWQQARATAAQLAAAEEPGVPQYDAVIVDEAQDLDPSALRLLVEVCAQPNRLFITADAHQSIYAAGFSWKSVHDDLRFQGRTGILKANHRSTQEITEAARDYLATGVPEDLKPDEQTYVHAGAMPAVRSVGNVDDESDLVARFLRGATREYRLTIGSGAVLVPDKWVGEPLARALEAKGIPAVYRDSRHFELDDNSVTVLPLVAAKGLEFPVVAVAGFGQSNWPHIEDGSDPEAIVEALVKARRTMFVAMTRAMRALLVVTPAENNSMLYDGFDPDLWNTEEQT